MLERNGLSYQPMTDITQCASELNQTRPCEQGNWDTWMVLDPWNQV